MNKEDVLINIVSELRNQKMIQQSRKLLQIWKIIIKFKRANLFIYFKRLG